MITKQSSSISFLLLQWFFSTSDFSDYFLIDFVFSSSIHNLLLIKSIFNDSVNIDALGFIKHLILVSFIASVNIFSRTTEVTHSSYEIVSCFLEWRFLRLRWLDFLAITILDIMQLTSKFKIEISKNITSLIYAILSIIILLCGIVSSSNWQKFVKSVSRLTIFVPLVHVPLWMTLIHNILVTLIVKAWLVKFLSILLEIWTHNKLWLIL